MGKVIKNPIMTPAPPHGRAAVIGVVPDSVAWRRVAGAYVHAATAQRKMIHLMSHYTQSTPSPSSALETNIAAPFRTGEAVASIAVLVGMAPAASSSGSVSAIYAAARRRWYDYHIRSRDVLPKDSHWYVPPRCSRVAMV